MRTYAYAAAFREAAPGDVTATFRDLPEAICGAATLDAARVLAGEALDAVVLHRLARKEDVPPPSALLDDEEWVVLEPATAARVALAAAMAEEQVSDVALARRLGRSERSVRQMLDVAGGGKIDAVLHALAALGRRAALTIQ